MGPPLQKINSRYDRGLVLEKGGIRGKTWINEDNVFESPFFKAGLGGLAETNFLNRRFFQSPQTDITSPWAAVRGRPGCWAAAPPEPGPAGRLAECR